MCSTHLTVTSSVTKRVINTPGGSVPQASQSMAACQLAARLSCQGTMFLQALRRTPAKLTAVHCRWCCCWPSCFDRLTWQTGGTSDLRGAGGVREMAQQNCCLVVSNKQLSLQDAETAERENARMAVSSAAGHVGCSMAYGMRCAVFSNRLLWVEWET
jgi:hypothetical protein